MNIQKLNDYQLKSYALWLNESIKRSIHNGFESNENSESLKDSVIAECLSRNIELDN